MTDRKLLELAAKAAGLEVLSMETKDCLAVRRDYCNHDYWNPLTDDGDALRLAVKLNLSIHYDTNPDSAIVVVTAPWSDDWSDFQWEEWFDCGNNPYTATRRAIVRASAEIGKATGEQQ